MAQRVLKTGYYVNHTPTSAVAMGAVVVKGDMPPLFAERAVVANALGSFNCGLDHMTMIEVPKAPTENYYDGQFLYWDETNSRVTSTQGGWLGYGFANGAYSNSDTTCTVERLPLTDVAAQNQHSS